MHLISFQMDLNSIVKFKLNSIQISINLLELSSNRLKYGTNRTLHHSVVSSPWENPTIILVVALGVMHPQRHHVFEGSWICSIPRPTQDH